MSALFSSPKIPAMPTPAVPPPPPSIDQAVQQQDQNSVLRQRRGAAASVLAGNSPLNPQTGPAGTLLGV